jgi:hypothetical protein
MLSLATSGKSRAFFRPSPARQEGRFAIVTKRGAEDAVDATSAQDECACRGRRSRGVLIPRRWYQVCGDRRRRRRQQARLSGETTKETVKTIARGMPGVSGVTVVDLLGVLFIFAPEAAGATSARHSLRPLFSGRTILQNPDVSRRGKRGGVTCVVQLEMWNCDKRLVSSPRTRGPITTDVGCEAELWLQPR